MPRSANPEAAISAGRTTARITVSLDPATRAAAIRNAAKRGFSKSLSAYIVWLIENDSANGGNGGGNNPTVPGTVPKKRN